MSEQRRRYLVTSALPYANGPLHVGQISGAYLPADAFVRYLRARGEDVVYVCGTDDHGVPITLRAEREGKSPQEVVDYWWAHMKETFGRFDISFDNFSHTSTPVARAEHPALLPQAQGGRLHLGGGVQADVQPDGGPLPARPLRGGHVPGVRLQGGEGRPVRQLRLLVRGLRAYRAALQGDGRVLRRSARPRTSTWICRSSRSVSGSMS